MTGSEYARHYHRRVTGLLDEFAQSQSAAVDSAARLVASSWEQGGRLLIAASAHCLHLEGTYRAGGPLATAVLAVGGEPADGLRLDDVESRDTVLIHSNAGTTEKVVELAIAVKGRGASTVALTQLPYENSELISSEHPSGSRLAETTDIVVDLGGDVGDATIDLPGSDFRLAPTSSAVGVVALWMIVASAAEQLVVQGHTPLVFASIQLPGGPEHNRRALEHVRDTGQSYVPRLLSG